MTGSNAAFGFSSASPPNSAELDRPMSRKSTESDIVNEGIQDPETSMEVKPTHIDLDRAWEQALWEVGLELKQAREERGISLNRLHSLTYIPSRHLKALETGNFEKLPPDIYVRGFIRKIGDALGLDGVQLAASLPERNPIAQKKVSTTRSLLALLVTPSPLHLYVGYAALLIVAFAGLASLNASIPPSSPSTPATSNPIDVDK